VDARGGGRIEWTRRESLQRAAAEAIFTLQEGGISPVVAAKDGLHLFRLDGIRSGSPLDVEGIRRAVRNELDGEARIAERACGSRSWTRPESNSHRLAP
jgi:parvulin-like peptidyl-prolyl isomerase